MGMIRFALSPDFDLAGWPEVHRAYMTAADGRVFPGRIELSDCEVSCLRTAHDSGKFHVSWPVRGRGRMMLSTGTLPERKFAYLLPLELARGKIVQVRNQVAVWEQAGMRIPEDFSVLFREAHRQFAKAALQQQEPLVSAQLAESAIETVCLATEILGRSYAVQALAGRRQRAGHHLAVQACDLAAAAPDERWTQWFGTAFDGVGVQLDWRAIEREQGNFDWALPDQQLEFCERLKLLPRSAPLIDFGPAGVPGWVSRWEHDLEMVISLACNYVESAMARYQGRIRWWEVSARSNTGGVLAFSEEQRVNLLAKVLETARQQDEEAQLVLRVDQPWGEYLARGQHRLSPLQLVDAILRSGIGLSAVNLEIAMGYVPRGTPGRDMLEVSRLIDQWSLLGIPLMVTLVCPSAVHVDPLADPELEVDPLVFGECSDEGSQSEWISRFYPLIAAKSAVIAVNWHHLTDEAPHVYPHGGLVNAAGQPKAALQALVSSSSTNGKDA